MNINYNPGKYRESVPGGPNLGSSRYRGGQGREEPGGVVPRKIGTTWYWEWCTRSREFGTGRSNTGISESGSKDPVASPPAMVVAAVAMAFGGVGCRLRWRRSGAPDSRESDRVAAKG
ncbi:hypothetical protein L6452_08383 [Arctium lappa]|uniref:Uncharacterized protein n=1 Tax=Arctium lappa TaxID=4217 RepID=A0ACB9DHZ0_ARCLA|nr:hypothetical protein L6452_08383 [Arctium lappa]